jgi:hypothetical protein
MTRGRAGIGKILVTAVVVLLLCGIVAGEFPELLSLTDNATNDFTLIKAKSAASPVLLVAKKYLPASDVNSYALAPTLVFSHTRPFENEAYVSSGALVLRSILRT